MSGIALVVLMFVLIFLGLPVTFSLLGSCLVFFLTNDLPLASFVQKMAVSMNSFSLIALPFFVLAGNLMNTGGITKRLFAFANELLGWLRGGLCYVAIVSNAIFSALSGSAMANAAGLGLMTIKEMKENGYDEDLSTCLIASASILGPIIPPSVILIVYGVTASVSIKKLFLGGIAPGVLFCILMAIFVNLLGRKNGKIPPKSDIHFSAQSLWKSFKGAFWALLMPVIILGGVFSGVFTATESGAIACLYAVIIGLFVHKDMTPKDILHTMLDTGKTTATILVISGAASLLGFCLTFDRVPQELADRLDKLRLLLDRHDHLRYRAVLGDSRLQDLGLPLLGHFIGGCIGLVFHDNYLHKIKNRGKWFYTQRPACRSSCRMGLRLFRIAIARLVSWMYWQWISFRSSLW